MSNSKTTAREFTGQLVRAPWFYKTWMLAGNPAYFFDRLVQDFGDFVQYRGLFHFYLVNHPSLVKRVLMETHDLFDKDSIIYRRFANAFGEGLVVAEGERWRRQRKLMQPLFSPIAVRKFFPIMRDAAVSMCDRWGAACRDGEVFDIAEEMERLTLQIAGRALFHDGFDQASEKIGHWTHTINRYSARPPTPISGKLWFPSPTNFRLKRTLREFHAFLHEMIANRRGGRQQDDLLSILLAARHEETDEPMTDEEIAEEALGMIIGGHETSSAALTWIWYELHRHPDVLEQLHEEIGDVIGAGPMELDHFPRLTYAKMIIDETLRLHPPFWFENRNAKEDVELGGEMLPKGSMVAFSRYSLHRHPDFWTEPERFDPERHRPDHEENKRTVYASVPFGGGPRICIGINFAILELVAILALVAGRYRVIVDQSDRHQMAAALTMAPKHGLRVRLERR